MTALVQERSRDCLVQERSRDCWHHRPGAKNAQRQRDRRRDSLDRHDAGERRLADGLAVFQAAFHVKHEAAVCPHHLDVVQSVGKEFWGCSGIDESLFALVAHLGRLRHVPAASLCWQNGTSLAPSGVGIDKFGFSEAAP